MHDKQAPRGVIKGSFIKSYAPIMPGFSHTALGKYAMHGFSERDAYFHNSP